jgi:hypothetical protein
METPQKPAIRPRGLRGDLRHTPFRSLHEPRGQHIPFSVLANSPGNRESGGGVTRRSTAIHSFEELTTVKAGKPADTGDFAGSRPAEKPEFIRLRVSAASLAGEAPWL